MYYICDIHHSFKINLFQQEVAFVPVPPLRFCRFSVVCPHLQKHSVKRYETEVL